MTQATTTQTTCAANCWYAREPECRCSCGGRAHGVLLTDGAEQPRRNCTILGSRYVLAAIDGGEVERVAWAFARELRDDVGARERYGRRYTGSDGTVRVLDPVVGQRGAVAWAKAADKSQRAWPEVAAWMADHTVERNGRAIVRRPYLLWIREDAVALYDVREG